MCAQCVHPSGVDLAFVPRPPQGVRPFIYELSASIEANHSHLPHLTVNCLYVVQHTPLRAHLLTARTLIRAYLGRVCLVVTRLV